MFFDMNGMGFHLTISSCNKTGRLMASIVDEAFLMTPLRIHVHDQDCVLRMIERYSGMAPGADIAQQIHSHFQSPAIAA